MPQAPAPMPPPPGPAPRTPTPAPLPRCRVLRIRISIDSVRLGGHESVCVSKGEAAEAQLVYAPLLAAITASTSSSGNSYVSRQNSHVTCEGQVAAAAISDAASTAVGWASRSAAGGARPPNIKQKKGKKAQRSLAPRPPASPRSFPAPPPGCAPPAPPAAPPPTACGPAGRRGRRGRTCVRGGGQGATVSGAHRAGGGQGAASGADNGGYCSSTAAALPAPVQQGPAACTLLLPRAPTAA